MLGRRSVLVGVGGVVAGGGTLLGTGAFATVSAERTATVSVAGDASSTLGLRPVDWCDFEHPGQGNGPPICPPADPQGNPPPFQGEGNPYVTEVDGRIEIWLGGVRDEADGLNPNAITTFRYLVEATNQSDRPITELTLKFLTSVIDPDDTFGFVINDGVDGSGYEKTDNGENVLTGTNGIPSQLGAGESIIFGITVDLIDGGDENNLLPEGEEYTLQITAIAAG